MDRSKLLPKTSAKSVYCLTDKELEGLEAIVRPNPRARSGPPMKLYAKESLEQLAIKRWGSMAGLEAERAKRQQRREQRSILSYVQRQPAGPDAAADLGAAATAAEAADMGLTAAGGAVQPSVQGSASSWLAGLRQPLLDRVYVVRRAEQLFQQPAALQGRYVLYWMRTAVRVHENPALDAAVHASHQLGLPLVVASFVLASHPFATARRVKFLLEGLRDVQEELRRQGGELLVYLEGHTERGQPVVSAAEYRQQQQQLVPGHASSSAADSGAAGIGMQQQQQEQQQQQFLFHPPSGFQQSVGWRRLEELASGAALVVAEDMPVSPHADWLQALAERLPPAVELCAVDTACVLPMRKVGRSFEKAYAFRAATASRRQASTRSTYTLQAPAGGAVQIGSIVGPTALAHFQLSAPAQQSAGALEQLLQLPWASLDLAALPDGPGLHGTLCGMVAACGGIYDQSVPPVCHMVGGFRAGYARWEDFRRRGLSLYGARRNDAMQRDGVSRLSAYHHWGMVSPFKIAREAALDKSAGASKYLDEFLTWREISYVFCMHNIQRLHSLAALPKWAQQTLQRHASDPRQPKPLADLAAGRTGDDWWDAAQSQLVSTGELANNSRMTWGKAVLPWASGPQEALLAALHLNHQYALDGCDPCSYGGVLWCFGLFDSPKSSDSTPVSGVLATRPTSRHARRLNPALYRALPV